MGIEVAVEPLHGILFGRSESSARTGPRQCLDGPADLAPVRERARYPRLKIAAGKVRRYRKVTGGARGMTGETSAIRGTRVGLADTRNVPALPRTVRVGAEVMLVQQ
jgi:hypothetical protein